MAKPRFPIPWSLPRTSQQPNSANTTYRQHISRTLLLQHVGFASCVSGGQDSTWQTTWFLLTMRWDWRVSPGQGQWGILVGFGLNLHLLLFPFWAANTEYPKEKFVITKGSNTRLISPAQWSDNTKNSYTTVLFAKGRGVCRDKISLPF